MSANHPFRKRERAQWAPITRFANAKEVKWAPITRFANAKEVKWAPIRVFASVEEVDDSFQGMIRPLMYPEGAIMGVVLSARLKSE